MPAAISLHHSALTFARDHAVLCGEIEACAVPVTATRLREAIERAALPVSVWAPPLGGLIVGVVDERGFFIRGTWHDDAASATRAYRSLCASLSPAPSQAGSAAGVG